MDVEGTTNAEKVYDIIDRKFNTNGIRVGVSASSEHPSGREISVCYTVRDKEDGVTIPSVPFDTLAENLPDTVDGDPGSENPNEIVENIPVNISRRHIEIDLYDSEYRPIPSGCQMSPGPCTIGYRAYHSGLGEWMQTTAGHCVETEGRNVGQPTSSEYIGSAYEVYNSGVNNGLDAATIRMPNERVSSDFAANDGSYRGWSIRGIITEEELRDHIGDSSYTISKQGIATGLSSGTVETV
ncbi:chymotrypsin family serine protease [Halalkalicoccus salilacus]|uniref:hypothetical protein n=1 Tax=Halalkalicoccus salilacus TaxID=3117459 RepID=UPI00300EECB0